MKDNIIDYSNGEIGYEGQVLEKCPKCGRLANINWCTRKAFHKSKYSGIWFEPIDMCEFGTDEN